MSTAAKVVSVLGGVVVLGVMAKIVNTAINNVKLAKAEEEAAKAEAALSDEVNPGFDKLWDMSEDYNYNDEWLGATGYFDRCMRDSVLVDYLHEHLIPGEDETKSSRLSLRTTATDGRRIVLFLVNGSVCTVFERYSDTKAVIVTNVDSRIRSIMKCACGGSFTQEDLEAIYKYLNPIA